MHQAGLLHRDLKLDNVMVRFDGVVKLMDFGLTKLPDASLQLTKMGAMLGTPLYMSPEQCRGALLDARSDLYAYGVMLYRALCGQMPFRGSSIAEVLMAHLQQTPNPPRDHNSQIGAALNDFVLKLLSKSPSERPANAQSVRQALLECLEQPVLTSSIQAAPRADFLLQVPLLGREAECLELEKALQTGGLVWLSGTAGIGKTALLEVVLQGALFVKTAALSEESTPYGIVSRLIEALAAQGLLLEASMEQRAIWQTLAPRVDLGKTAVLLSSDPALGKLQLLEGFLALLRHVQVGLVFEDLQWADVASLELIQYALLHTPEAQVVVSFRQDEFLPRKHLPTPKLHITLAGLPDPTMTQLVQGWLGAPVEPALNQELLRGTGGNPWFLRERLSSMIHDGNILQRLGVFEWTRSIVYLPESVSDLLQKRVQKLESRTLEFAQAGSIFGQEFEFLDVQRLLEWSEDACFDALEDLLRVQIIAEYNADVFVFTHPSFSEALYQKILSLKLRLWHRRAASLLEAREQKDTLLLAKHYFRSQQFGLALPLALAAAKDYLARFAYLQAEFAFRIAQQALQDAPDAQQEAQMQQGLAETLYALGHTTEAFLLWTQALKNPHALSRAHLAMATAYSSRGDHAAALEVLAALDTPEALLVRADCLQRAGQNTAAIRCCLAVLPSLRYNQDLVGQSRALTTLAWAMHSQQRFRRGLALAHLAVKHAVQNPYLRLLAYRALYANQYDLDDYIGAEKTLHAALEMPITNSQLQHQLWFEMALANLLVLQDHLPKAAQHYAHVLNNAKRAEVQSVLEKSAFALVLTHHMQNQLELAQNTLENIVNPALRHLWQCRLELAQGLKLEPPPNLERLPVWSHGLQQVCYLEWLVATQQDQAVLESVPDTQYQWFWAVAQVVARWRTGQPWVVALQASKQPMSDTGLSGDLVKTYNQALETALVDKNTHALLGLRRSAMGVFVRAILGF